MKWTALALAVPCLAACEGPQSTLDPAGAGAREVATLWWAMFVWLGLLWVIISCLWVYALARRPREREEREETRINNRWVIGGGLLLPTLTVIALLLWGIPTGRSMLPLPVTGEQPLIVEVTGNQWWWEVHYPEAGVTTANQFIVPVGRPVDVQLKSRDVIHSFWVPRLAGKRDMVPGRTQVLRIEAEQPGMFRGQCSEFCGAQHARMLLHAEAMPAEAFRSWLEARRDLHFERPPGTAGEVFDNRCGRCHRVAGVSNGNRAPDLSDLASRPTLGAGTLPNDSDNLRRWLREHQNLKHGNAMPTHDDVDDSTLEAIAAWLETLAP